MPRFSDEMKGSEGEPVYFQRQSGFEEEEGVIVAVSSDNNWASIRTKAGEVVYFIPFFAIRFQLEEAG